MCHSLVYQAADCAANFNSSHNSNVLYPANSMSKFTMIFHLCLLREFNTEGSASMSSLSYVKYIRNGVSTFINFPVGDHSFTSYMMLSVWSILEPRGYLQAPNFSYLRTYPFWTFISKSSSKNILRSVNDFSFLLVLRTSPLETVREDTITPQNAWM